MWEVHIYMCFVLLIRSNTNCDHWTEFVYNKKISTATSIVPISVKLINKHHL